MALVERKINVTFLLGEGSFGESGTNTVIVKGLRTSVRIDKSGGPSQSHLSLDIWGMTPSLMGQLATLGPKQPTLLGKNTVIVDAGDDINGISTVFIGAVLDGYSDYQASPQVAFHVEANSGAFDAVARFLPTSFPQGGDVATMLRGLAKRIDLDFEPNGVQRTLPASYLIGSAWDQIHRIIDAAGLESIVDEGKLAIWEPNGSRGGLIPRITKDSGLIGYPGYTFSGIIFKTILNPHINFGGLVEVESARPELKKVNGIWKVINLDYSLDANLPGGDWSMTVQANQPSHDPVIPSPSR